MDLAFPPIDDPQRLSAELARVRSSEREDALHEAWVAQLEGRDPVQAIKCYALREWRYRRRCVPIDDVIEE
jgi:hypothetical protein